MARAVNMTAKADLFSYKILDSKCLASDEKLRDAIDVTAERRHRMGNTHMKERATATRGGELLTGNENTAGGGKKASVNSLEKTSIDLSSKGASTPCSDILAINFDDTGDGGERQPRSKVRKTLILVPESKSAFDIHKFAQWWLLMMVRMIVCAQFGDRECNDLPAPMYVKKMKEKKKRWTVVVMTWSGKQKKKSPKKGSTAVHGSKVSLGKCAQLHCTHHSDSNTGWPHTNFEHLEQVERKLAQPDLNLQRWRLARTKANKLVHHGFNQLLSRYDACTQFLCVLCTPRNDVISVFRLTLRDIRYSTLERFCIPFYGIFKTESLSDRVRVRPAASLRWLSTKTVLHIVGRFGGFVWRFRGSGRAIVLSRSRWISSLLIFWPRTKAEIWTKKNFFFFFSHTEWKTLQLVSLPPFQFALISWMKRPVFDVFDCSFVRDCFLLQFSLFLCCSIRRSPADFLERPAKRSGCTITNFRATSSRAGCPRRKTPTPFALACRKRSRPRISLPLSLQVEPQLLPFSSHVAEQTGNKNKNEPNKSFWCCRSLSTTAPGCELSENDRRNFAQIPFRSTVWATVSESIFGTRTQTSTFRPKNSVERNAKPPYSGKNFQNFG